MDLRVIAGSFGKKRGGELSKFQEARVAKAHLCLMVSYCCSQSCLPSGQLASPVVSLLCFRQQAKMP